MSRRVSEALRPELNAKAEPAAFWYREVRDEVEVLATWRLCDRWWDREGYSDRLLLIRS